MIICKIPRYKDNAIYKKFLAKGMTKSFKSEEEFRDLQDLAFNSVDFVRKVSLGASYLQALNGIDVTTNSSDLVTSKLIGYTAFGQCAIISFSYIRKTLIENGQIDSKEIDSTYSALVFLKVCTFQ